MNYLSQERLESNRSVIYKFHTQEKVLQTGRNALGLHSNQT